MKITYSISFLFLLLFAVAIGVRAWQLTRPLDHFEIDISGHLVAKLPTNTFINIERNPDHNRGWDSCRFGLAQLPAAISKDYSSTGCVAEFWATDSNGNEQRLFSIVVDREMFDRYRVITLRLDKPIPELRPNADFWASLQWSPNITRRMRYLELPWWDEAAQKLSPMPTLPELITRQRGSSQILEKSQLRHYDCDFDYFYGEFAEDGRPSISSLHDLLFSVTYDSGGLFDQIRTDFHFKYDDKRHSIW